MKDDYIGDEAGTSARRLKTNSGHDWHQEAKATYKPAEPSATRRATSKDVVSKHLIRAATSTPQETSLSALIRPGHQEDQVQADADGGRVAPVKVLPVIRVDLLR